MIQIPVFHNDLYKDAWKIVDAIAIGQPVQLYDYYDHTDTEHFNNARVLFELFDLAFEKFPIQYVLKKLIFPRTDAFDFCLEYWQRSENQRY